VPLSRQSRPTPLTLKHQELFAHVRTSSASFSPRKTASQLGAFRAKPPTLVFRLARRHRLDPAYRDCRPVRGGLVERAVCIPVPAPAVRDHTGHPKAGVGEPFPPGQLLRTWAAVAHAHVVSLIGIVGVAYAQTRCLVDAYRRAHSQPSPSEHHQQRRYRPCGGSSPGCSVLGEAGDGDDPLVDRHGKSRLR
jgi:hypothetical protein